MEENKLEIEIKNKIKTLFTGTLINIIGEGTKRLSGYLYQILIIKLLELKIYGIYTICYTLINIVLRFSQLGLERGGIRYISILREENYIYNIKKLTYFLFFLSFISGIFWGTLTNIFSGVLSNLYKKQEIKEGLFYFSLTLPFYTSLLVLAYSSRGFKKMLYYVLSENISRPILQIVFLFLLFYFFGKKIFVSILPWLFSSIISLLLILYFFKKEINTKKKEPIQKDLFKEVVIFSYPIVFISILYFLFAWTDIIVMGIFRSSEEVGIYNAVARTAEMANVLLLAINEVFAPFISTLSYKRDYESLKTLYQTIIRWTLHFSLPLFIFFFFSGKDFLLIVFGNEFIQGYIPMLILLFGLLYQNLLGESPMTLTMSGFQKEWAVTTFFGLIINILLAVTLIPKFGILGASISTSLSLIILRTLGLFEIKKFMKFKTHNLKTFKPLAQGICTFALIFLINLFFLEFLNNKIINLLGNFLISYLIYFLLFLIFGIEREEKIIIDSLIELLKGKYKVLK
ncbi:MAG: flippase [Candidatus Hydrothermales bacterium]